MLTFSKQEFLQNWVSTTSGNDEVGIALLLETTPAFYEQKDDVSISHKLGWSKLLGYLKQQRKLIAQLFIGLLVGSLLQLIFPFLTQSIVDVGIATHTYNSAFSIQNNLFQFFCTFIS